ncbi:uncharacterized protein LOC134037660 isoform X2 [Osmerus eperlanus]|uniref:uncharacterized protein LOC134037660 isoform X2 n=1 Tax=Osmerus eperlanus TaxID=29151 RepID=UPI002E10ED26
MANNSDSASEIQHTKEGVNTPPPFVQIDVNPLGVLNSVPQYSEPALESGIHVLPSQYSETTFIPDLPEVLGPSTPVSDPQSDSRSINSELYENYENIDNFPSLGQEAPGNSVYREEHDADPPSSVDPSSQEVLLRIKEQASAHVRAQKNQHFRDLSLKKLKLQQLLLKLDTITGSEDLLSGSQYSLEEEELLSMGDSGVEGRAPLGSEDRQREGEDERSLVS